MTKINNERDEHNMSDGKIIRLFDRLGIKDELVQNFVSKTKKKKGGFRTSIEMRNEFGELLFSHEQNETVLGGVLTVLEKLAGVQSTLKVASINHLLGINDVIPLNESSATDDDILCLWGVGIGGSGDAFGSRRDVKFYEREIGMNGHTEQMIPFRVVAEPFGPTDDNAQKYFMMRQREDGLYEYFLKTFEKIGNDNAVIKTLYKDGAEGDDGSEVPTDVYMGTRSDEIESFLEIHLQSGKRDIHEYWEHVGEMKSARFNTIGLFTGRKVEISDGRFDYVNVKLFSKLTFDNEPLQNAKTLNLIYRIYGA